MTAVDRVVGVLGGMGPDATIDFMAKVVAATPAKVDQDHVRMLVDHNPRVPARNIDDPAQKVLIEEALKAMALGLEKAGADFLVMPCNAAHGFIGPAVEAVGIPFVHLVEETVRGIPAQAGAATRIGLMAVNASIRAGIYRAAIEKAGLQMLVPNADTQTELMRLILLVKQGRQDQDVRAGMRAVANSLLEDGAEAIIAGCTEIPLVLHAGDIVIPVISSTDVLAARTVEYCLGQKLLPTR